MTMPQTELRDVSGRATSGPILVATDATSAAEPALAAARVLSQRHGAAVEVLSVLEPIAPIPPVVGGVPVPPDQDSDRIAALRKAVEEQVREVVGERNWTIEVVQGQPAAVIARRASRSGARMVILGIGRHNVADRLFGDETALRVLRLADVPVFAVTPGFEALPTRILVATDFSPSSMIAARVAFGFAAPGATVELAHVSPGSEPLLAPWERFGGQPPKHDFSDALRRAKDELDAPEGITLETVELSGRPAQSLLEHARSSGAEMIVAGSHGYGFLQRMFVGSVATRMLRGSTVPVLVVPQSFVSAREAEVEGRPPMYRVHAVQEKEWAARLEQFTKRNAGRRCMVEVDDPTYGAQLQGVDYPLAGVSYDHKDRRVEIMLGNPDAGNHLSKSMGGVTAVDVVEGVDGRDRVLRIAHGHGQTLLTIA